MKPRVEIITAFPDLIKSYIGSSVLGRGIEAGLIEVGVTDLRAFAEGQYRKIDDYAYGSGGMVLMAEPLERAVEAAAPREGRYVVSPSPQGVPLNQEVIEDLRRTAGIKKLVIVCGHYEGMDERFVERSVDLEVSLGDFVLTGGELAALAITDAVSRLVKGVVGRERSVENDSFFDGMLDTPHYTRPPVWRGMPVPEALLGGSHADIDAFRRGEASARTTARRPGLVEGAAIMPYLRHGVYVIQLHEQVLDRHGNPSVTAITGMDVHDIARACRTYGVAKYIIATPLAPQREIIKRLAAHWTDGGGAALGPDRAEAMRLVKTFASYRRALEWIEKREKAAPLTVATSARMTDRSESWGALKRRLLTEGRPAALLFGTGHGLAGSVIDEADCVLTPIDGREQYRHLSVRSAASITLDRLFGWR